MDFAHRSEKASRSDSAKAARDLLPRSGGHETEARKSSLHDVFTGEATRDPEVLRCRAALMSHWADEGFDQVTTGIRGQSIPMRQAPAQIAMPKELTQGMRVAWNQSMPQGSAQENGGLLARNRDGSLKWLRSPPGSAKEIRLSYDNVNPHQTVLANGHTHPYDKSEHGHTDVTLSGGDLAAQVFDDERLSIVQSGEGVFASARTREFDEMIKERGPGGRWGLSKEIEKFWQKNYKDAKGTLREKAEAATQATTDWYHLIYYSGRPAKDPDQGHCPGILRRVDTASKFESGDK
jgi:hypothetical protein